MCIWGQLSLDVTDGGWLRVSDTAIRHDGVILPIDFDFILWGVIRTKSV